jgi:hypothetical protein
MENQIDRRSRTKVHAATNLLVLILRVGVSHGHGFEGPRPLTSPLITPDRRRRLQADVLS